MPGRVARDREHLKAQIQFGKLDTFLSMQAMITVWDGFCGRTVNGGLWIALLECRDASYMICVVVGNQQCLQFEIMRLQRAKDWLGLAWVDDQRLPVIVEQPDIVVPERGYCP